MNKALKEIQVVLQGRRLGHTYALRTGADNTPKAIVICNQDGLYPNNKTLTTKEVEEGGLRGLSCPLLIDHEALCDMLDS